MTTEQQFWAIVKECLTDLYGMTDASATKAIKRLWSRGSKGERVVPSARNIIYHSAPIHIAGDLAGKEVLSEVLWNRYKRLLKHYDLPAGVSGKKVAIRAVNPKSARNIKQDARMVAVAGR